MGNFIKDALARRETEENIRKERIKKEKKDYAQKVAGEKVSDDEIISLINKYLPLLNKDEVNLANRCINDFNSPLGIQPGRRNGISKILANKIMQEEI